MSFFNTFNFLVPISIIALILFLSYQWYNSFRFLLIFNIMWFEFYSPFFVGFYFFLFLLTSLFLYLLISKIFSTQSRVSLIILLGFTELIYLLVNRGLIYIENLLNAHNFAIKLNLWIFIRELITYSILILLINETINIIKKKFIINYEK